MLEWNSSCLALYFAHQPIIGVPVVQGLVEDRSSGIAERTLNGGPECSSFGSGPERTVAESAFLSHADAAIGKSAIWAKERKSASR